MILMLLFNSLETNGKILYSCTLKNIVLGVGCNNFFLRNATKFRTACWAWANACVYFGCLLRRYQRISSAPVDQPPTTQHLGHHRYTVRGITGWRRAIGGQSGRGCDRPLSRGRVRIHWYNSHYRPYRRTHSTSGCTLRARLTSLGRRRGQDDAPTTLHTPTDAKLPTSVAIAAILKRQLRDAPLPASGRRETRTAVVAAVSNCTTTASRL